MAMEHLHKIFEGQQSWTFTIPVIMWYQNDIRAWCNNNQIHFTLENEDDLKKTRNCITNYCWEYDVKPSEACRSKLIVRMFSKTDTIITIRDYDKAMALKLMWCQTASKQI